MTTKNELQHFFSLTFIGYPRQGKYPHIEITKKNMQLATCNQSPFQQGVGEFLKSKKKNEESFLT